MGSQMQRILVVGIGNIPLPRTRHSIGHYILDSLAESSGLRLTQHNKLDGYFAKGEVSLHKRSVELSLFKPKPLMNILGGAVKQACRETVGKPLSMLVIEDSLNLEPCKLKVKFGPQPGGHKGIESITKALGQDARYFRLQVGIGRGGVVRDYVLGPLSSHEKQYWSTQGKGIDDVWDQIERIAERMQTEANLASKPHSTSSVKLPHRK